MVSLIVCACHWNAVFLMEDVAEGSFLQYVQEICNPGQCLILTLWSNFVLDHLFFLAFLKPLWCTFCPEYITEHMAAKMPQGACIIGCDRPFRHAVSLLGAWDGEHARFYEACKQQGLQLLPYQNLKFWYSTSIKIFSIPLQKEKEVQGIKDRLFSLLFLHTVLIQKNLNTINKGYCIILNTWYWKSIAARILLTTFTWWYHKLQLCKCNV